MRELNMPCSYSERLNMAVKRAGYYSQTSLAKAAHVEQPTVSRAIANPAQLFARALIYARVDPGISDALDDIWQAERMKR